MPAERSSAIVLQWNTVKPKDRAGVSLLTYGQYKHRGDVVDRKFEARPQDDSELVITVKDVGALECISYLGREKFLEYLQDIDNTYDKTKFKEASLALSDEFRIKKIDDVYSYVKQIQEKTDLTEIQYTEEYYE